MPNEVFNSLLKEYAQKKLHAELDLEKRKEQLYLNIPKLQEIENELNSFAISTAKNILSNSTSSIENLQDKISILKEEKYDILKENGIAINYLSPFYECSKCNDTGYIQSNNYNPELCNCLKQKLIDISFNESNMSNLNKENFNTFDENLFSDEINISKYNFNISPRDNIKDIKEKCTHFVNTFDDPSTKNLLFVGNTGLR